MFQKAADHVSQAFGSFEGHVADKAVAHHDVGGAFENIVAFNVAKEVQVARVARCAQQVARLFDDLTALDGLGADIEQPHGRLLLALEHRIQRRAHHGKLQQMVLGAIDVGAQVQHRGGAARGIGQLAGNGRPVDAIEGFEHIARNGHQGAGVARRHRRCRCTVLDLLDGHPHGGVFLAAQCHLDRVFHGHHFAGVDQGSALVNKALQGLWQAHQQEPRILALIQKPAARRQRDAGAMVAPHAINGQCNHVCLFQSTPPVGGANLEEASPLPKNSAPRRGANLKMQRSKQRPVLQK